MLISAANGAGSDMLSRASSAFASSPAQNGASFAARVGANRMQGAAAMPVSVSSDVRRALDDVELSLQDLSSSDLSSSTLSQIVEDLAATLAQLEDETGFPVLSTLTKSTEPSALGLRGAGATEARGSITRTILTNIVRSAEAVIDDLVGQRSGALRVATSPSVGPTNDILCNASLLGAAMQSPVNALGAPASDSGAVEAGSSPALYHRLGVSALEASGATSSNASHIGNHMSKLVRSSTGAPGDGIVTPVTRSDLPGGSAAPLTALQSQAPATTSSMTIMSGQGQDVAQTTNTNFVTPVTRSDLPGGSAAPLTALQSQAPATTSSMTIMSGKGQDVAQTTNTNIVTPVTRSDLPGGSAAPLTALQSQAPATTSSMTVMSGQGQDVAQTSKTNFGTTLASFAEIALGTDLQRRPLGGREPALGALAGSKTIAAKSTGVFDPRLMPQSEGKVASHVVFEEFIWSTLNTVFDQSMAFNEIPSDEGRSLGSGALVSKLDRGAHGAQASTASNSRPAAFSLALAQQLRTAYVDEGSTRVQLSPRGLGHIEIEVATTQEKTTHITIRSDNSTVLSALREMKDALSVIMDFDSGSTLSFEGTAGGQDREGSGFSQRQNWMQTGDDRQSGKITSGDSVGVIDGSRLDITT